MAHHIRGQVKVDYGILTDNIEWVTLELEMAGFPPRRWELNGLVDEADIWMLEEILSIGKEEMRGLTVDQYSSLPLVTRVRSMSDMALSVSNIRARFQTEE